MSTALIASSLKLQAATPVTGFALQNGTPSIISWTPPNDGLLHYAAIFACLDVTSAETGGEVDVNFTAPSGNAGSGVLAGGGHGVVTLPANTYMVPVKAGSAIAVVQGSALTAGAAKIWASIWGY